MKREFQTAIASIALALSFVACSSDNKNEPAAPAGAEESRPAPAEGDGSGPQGTASAPAELYRVWKTECKETALLGQDTQEIYRFEQDQTQVVQQYFTDTECQLPAIEVRYSGSFEVGKAVTANDMTAQEINLLLQKVTVTPVSEDGRLLLTNLDFCKQGEWTLNQEVDLTEKSELELCPLRDTPHTVYDIFVVQEEKLRFGKVEEENDKTDPEKRAVHLDTEMALTPVVQE